MPRVFLKGGVWKNSEDEILKAAVMKYGKNMWGRVSSLLPRKSAAQCKARWNEWLDPSIKKTEWSREEEEKLLHLVKLMPTQWRTIAPMVGRTAAQCLTHYEKLIDQAQSRDGEGVDPRDDPRRLRPGEIDPSPETKPALPDPIDMEEDDKEMLQEARARLANTKGKKAKRKAREKQLEESKRLASQQKRREMKAAGLEIHQRRKRTSKNRHQQMDYNVEIPFHSVQKPGFYDVSEEAEREAREAKNRKFKQMDLATFHRPGMKGLTIQQKEELARKKDKAAFDRKKRENLPEALKQISKLNDPSSKMKRSKLHMPSPQLTEAELEEIARMSSDDAALAAAAQQVDGDVAATRALLAQYGSTPTPGRGGTTPFLASANAAAAALAKTRGGMTPQRTPSHQDRIMQEARNILALNSATPLLGGELPKLEGSVDFSGVTPSREAPQTPNPIATLVREGGVTPRRPGAEGATPARRGAPATPRESVVRDALAINSSEFGDFSASTSARVARANRAGLASQLGSLPSPQNEYGVELPDDDELRQLDEEERALEVKRRRVEDAEEIERRRLEEERLLAEQRRKEMSQVMQQELPRPARVSAASVGANIRDKNKVLDLIRRETLTLVRHEHSLYPTGKKAKPGNGDPSFERVSLDRMERARELVLAEVEANEARYPPFEEFEAALIRQQGLVVYQPNEKRFSPVAQLSAVELVAARTFEFEQVRDKLNKETQRAQKLSKRIGVRQGGYARRHDRVAGEVVKLEDEIESTRSKLASFELLARNEDVALPARLEKLQGEVKRLQEREATLQDRYARLAQIERELPANGVAA